MKPTIWKIITSIGINKGRFRVAAPTLQLLAYKLLCLKQGKVYILRTDR